MRKWSVAVLLGIASVAGAAPPEQFDYYVLALSWSPNWCAREGSARGADQCDPRHGHGWTLHGLWPQYETGWPQYCDAPRALDPTRAQSDAMADIMGSGGLAWHEWKKHGRCSGLSGTAYYDLNREAYETVTRPPAFRKLSRSAIFAASDVEEAWLIANPQMRADQIITKCRDVYITEVRICLTKDLELRACGTEISRDCVGKGQMNPIR